MLEAHLKERLKDKEILLMTHMVLGYPSFEDNWAMLETMEAAGADVVELQFPFSEPVADGPVFVKANQASLDAGTTIEQCFDFMTKASEAFTMPLLMMGYYNTVFAKGEDVFCDRLKAAGAVGAIVPDLPVELGDEYLEGMKSRGLSSIQIVTPNTSLDRKQTLADNSAGMVYCVARKGVTGKKTDFGNTIGDYLKDVRSVTGLPLAIGFGVKSHDDIRALISPSSEPRA